MSNNPDIHLIVDNVSLHVVTTSVVKFMNLRDLEGVGVTRVLLVLTFAEPGRFVDCAFSEEHVGHLGYSRPEDSVLPVSCCLNYIFGFS